DGIVVSETARDEGVELGDTVVLDRVDTELRVVGFAEGQATFGHVDIAYLPLDTWRLIASGQALPGAPTQEQVDAVESTTASAIALQSAGGAPLEESGIDVAKGDAAAGTVTSSLTESFNASPGYAAETMTLDMIQVFLY